MKKLLIQIEKPNRAACFVSSYDLDTKRIGIVDYTGVFIAVNFIGLYEKDTQMVLNICASKWPGFIVSAVEYDLPDDVRFENGIAIRGKTIVELK